MQDIPDFIRITIHTKSTFFVVISPEEGADDLKNTRWHYVIMSHDSN